MHVGFDNGLGGGIVALSDIEGLPPIAMIPMPTLKRKRRSKGKKKSKYESELDTAALLKFLEEIQAKNDGTTIFHVEQCPRTAQKMDSMRVMSFTYGKIIGILEAKYDKAPLKRVRCGNDNDGWQKALLGRTGKGETKPAALALARKLWPEETWLPSDRCTVPHDGMIDGALIAFFGRRKWTAGNPPTAFMA